ncbi:MAG: DUF342 domain-containing protein [Spirochaetaceae bacterium]|nr:MAG: DUF342 domain-containing protein [Spirochaetaceae bacterium]
MNSQNFHNKGADGRYSLYYQAGWVYLAINPQLADRVYEDEIASRMKILRMPRVEAAIIRAAIKDADGSPHKLIEWPEGKNLASSFSTKIDEDEMTAQIMINPPSKGAAPPTFEEVVKQLEAAGITHGICKDNILGALSKNNYQQWFVCARGQAPVFGSAHRIEYLFKTDRGKPFLTDDFGRMNLKELHFIEMVEKDQQLARLLEPISPVDGFTVSGKELKAETDDQIVALQAGPNTRLNNDATILLADCDGNARLVDGSVCVEPVIQVKNVDYSTGNIEFDGSVIVAGRVADGFSVVAGGEIHVGHSVGRARLKAGRSIILKSGMNGNESGIIECGQDLYSKYLEGCEIHCHGSMFIEEAIMHSKVYVRGHCLLGGRRAEIIGGATIVGGSCWCKKLGGISEHPTHVSIGIPPQILAEYRQNTEEIDRMQLKLDDVRLKKEQIEKALQTLPGDETRSAKLIGAQEQLIKQEDELSSDLNDAREKNHELKTLLMAMPESMLVVEDTIFAGVSVSFGKQEYRAPQKGARKTILKWHDEHIAESGFDIRNKPGLSLLPEQDMQSDDLSD